MKIHLEGWNTEWMRRSKSRWELKCWKEKKFSHQWTKNRQWRNFILHLRCCQISVVSPSPLLFRCFTVVHSLFFLFTDHSFFLSCTKTSAFEIRENTHKKCINLFLFPLSTCLALPCCAVCRCRMYFFGRQRRRRAQVFQGERRMLLLPIKWGIYCCARKFQKCSCNLLKFIFLSSQTFIYFFIYFFSFAIQIDAYVLFTR